MSNRQISRAFISNLLSLIDIIELIGSKIELKKHGKNFFAYCPFHREKTPSFTVNAEKKFYYCFGCGAHGNAIDFLMNYDKLEFIETIKKLAIIYNLEVPCKSVHSLVHVEQYRQKKLYILMDNIKKTYQQFFKKPESKQAQKYLETRGIKHDVISRFSIGYSPPLWKNKLKFLIKNNYENNQLLVEAGILINSDNRYSYDRFQNRIVFPIHDKLGRVIGFGGRVIDRNVPKYLNSPETVIFRKSQQLYGIYEAIKEETKPQYLLLVEGYMDVISLAQHGINNSVASLGTITTHHHIRTLFKTTKKVICCYDGDDAGRQAAWRTLETAIPYINDENQLSFMFLPEGEDPDSLIHKEGKKIFEIRIKQAKSFSTFLFNTLLSRIDLNKSNDITQLAALALPLINLIPNETLRIRLRRKLGVKIGVFDDIKLNKLITTENKNFFTHKKNPKIKRTTMHILIGLLIQNPSLSKLVPSLDNLNPEQFPGLSLFLELVNICLLQKNLSTEQLLKIYRNTKKVSTLEKLFIWDDIVDKEIAREMFIDSINHLLNSSLEKRASELITRSRIYGLTLVERKEVKSIIETCSYK